MLHRKNHIKNPNTIHTRRTMMYEELNLILSKEILNLNLVIQTNAINKKTNKNLVLTVTYLSKLYPFDNSISLWKVFLKLWGISADYEKRIMTLFYAMSNDDLLKLTSDIILSVDKGDIN